MDESLYAKIRMFKTHITGYSLKHGYMFRLFLSQRQTVQKINGQCTFTKLTYYNITVKSGS